MKILAKILLAFLLLFGTTLHAKNRTYLDTNYQIIYADTTSYETIADIGPYLVYYYYPHSRDTANQIFNYVEDMALERKDYKTISFLYYEASYRTLDMEVSLRYELLKKSKLYAEVARDTAGITRQFARMLDFHFQLRDTSRYYKLLDEAQESYEKYGLHSQYIRHNYAVAYHLSNLGNRERALECALRGYHLILETKDSAYFPHITVWVANAYQGLGMADSAHKFYDIYRDWAIVYDKPKSLGESYRYRSSLFMTEGDYQLANKYLDTALQCFIRAEQTNRMGLMLGLQAYNCLEVGAYQEGATYMDRYYADFEKESDSGLELFMDEVAAKLYGKIGRFGRAYELLENCKSISDSLNESSPVMELQDAINQYNLSQITEKAEREKKFAALEKEKDEVEKAAAIKTRNIFVWTGSAGILILMVILILIYRNLQQKKKANAEIQKQKEQIEVAHEEIQDSIAYAKRIQSAILPSEKMWDRNLHESIVLYLPKDVVAGDFYWMAESEKQVLFAAADCTGHGVPGAMVSVLCVGGLNRSVNEFGLIEPGKILDKTRELVIKEFAKSEEEVKDGMDVALCSLELPSEGIHPLDESGTVTLKYAGAHNNLWIIRKDGEEVEETKADKQPIGKYAEETPFKTHSIEVQKGDTIYLHSDGYADQFGGPKGKKFKSANFKRLLLRIKDLPMSEQKKKLQEAFEDWKGELEQVDDICVIGLRV